MASAAVAEWGSKGAGGARIRLVLMGAGGVGKSALVVQQVQGRFVERYDPTIEDVYQCSITVSDGRVFRLEILDTAGTQMFTSMRSLYIRKGGGLCLVFSLVDAETVKEVESIAQLVQEINDQDVPMVIVANKEDLASDMLDAPESNPEEVERVRKTREAGRQLAERLGRPFFETSAKTGKSVAELFQTLAMMCAERLPPPPRTSWCFLF